METRPLQVAIQCIHNEMEFSERLGFSQRPTTIFVLVRALII